MTTSAPAQPWRVRDARESDVQAVHALILALAHEENAADAVLATSQDLREALFAADPLVHCVVAEVDDPALGPRVAGMALWFVSYSTWRGVHGLWLEDLFVEAACRRLGLGAALLGRLAAVCVERGYARLEWSVLDWNEPAIGFYRRLGAQPLAEWTTWRLQGPALIAASRATSAS